MPPQTGMAIGSPDGSIIDRTEPNFYSRYLLRDDNSNFRSPEGNTYYSSANYSGSVAGGRWKPDTGRERSWAFSKFHFGTGTYCDGEYKVAGGGPNNYAIQIMLESGGAVCLDG